MTELKESYNDSKWQGISIMQNDKPSDNLFLLTANTDSYNLRSLQINTTYNANWF